MNSDEYQKAFGDLPKEDKQLALKIALRKL